MLGKIEVDGQDLAFDDPNVRNLVSEVSITEPRVFGKGNAIKVSAANACHVGLAPYFSEGPHSRISILSVSRY